MRERDGLVENVYLDRVGNDVDAWDGGPGLAQLYAFLREELVGANIAGFLKVARAMVAHGVV